MKLERQSVNDPEAKRGTWLFYITGKESEIGLIEKAESLLCDMVTPWTVGGNEVKWQKHSDTCPGYSDGYSSGFWIPMDHVEEFKEAWKQVKAQVK